MAEKRAWEIYLEHDVIGKENTDGLRVYQVVVRIRGEGLQGIIKVRKGDEYKVQFLGAGTFSLLAEKVRNAILKDSGKWRKDNYPPI